MIIIAFCLCELLTFKECCGLAMVVVLNKLLVPPHVCQGLHCQLAVVYEIIYYSDSHAVQFINKNDPYIVALITFLHE